MIKYPIGVQSFESLRNDGYLYIDKTELIYKLATEGKYYFLSRPRRFGKSLLISTLEAYFRGEKDLFKGLAMERLERDWTEYPVLHLDLNVGEYKDNQMLLDTLNETLSEWEKVYGCSEAERNIGLRFKGIIRRAYEKTGRQVVILVDEYDKPLVQNIVDEKLQEQQRSTLRLLYSVLKTQDRYIKFVLLTGVSKFGKLSVFSDLNNLEDISMDKQWATICGITEAEIHSNLEEGVRRLAESTGEGYDETVSSLRRTYNGYHFEYDSEGVYNPFSLLSALKRGRLGDYWFETGTPSFIVEVLKRTDYELPRLSEEEQTSDMLNSIDGVLRNPVPLLYQSGYLTIKGYDADFRYYKLGFPNEEVRRGFLNYLLPFYSPCEDSESVFYIRRFVKEIRGGEVDSFLERLQALFADNSYQVMGKMEVYFQNAMYVLFKVLGFYVEVEHATHRGRIDLLVKTPDYIYVIEIKLDGSAADALRQINEKGYAAPFSKDPRKLFKVGVNFSSATKGIGEWKVE